jgi:NAD(P)-dependent dehydrogenase (short-subunit alcohol dehydrogenase family)
MTIKKIIVTGSSRGIGLAIATKLIKEGHNVVLNGRNKKKFTKINKKIKYEVGNFSDPNSAKKVISNSVKTLKGLDVLICNIGESKSCMPNKESFTEWKKMFNQNFFTATNAIEAAKKKLIQSKGSIICISSICGNELIKGAPITYSTAKAALNFYAKSLSHYLSSFGVRINVISPGNILFPGSVWDKKMRKDKHKTENLIKRNVPLNKFGSTKDVTELVSYLVSDKSKFITGSNFVVDGGQTIKF